MKEIFIVDDEFQSLVDQLQLEKSKGNFEAVRRNTKRLEEEAKKAENGYVEAIAYYFHAIHSLFYNELEDAKKYCLKIKENYEKYQYHALYALICMIHGTTYVYSNERQNAINSLLEGYYLSLEYSLIELQSQILNNIGSVFHDLREYEKALEYYFKAYEVVKSYGQNPQREKEILFINVSNSYVRKKEFKKVRLWENGELSKEVDKESPLIKYSTLANHILMDYQNITKEEMEKRVDEFLCYMGKIGSDSYFVGVILDVAKCCIDIKDIELSKKCVKVLEKKIEDSKNQDQKEDLLYIKTQLYELIGNKDILFEELIRYRNCMLEGKVLKRKNESVGLVSKIELEQSKYEQKKIELKNEELKRKSELDAFTGVFNKVAFEEKVRKRLDKNSDTTEDILILIDIDNFKRINDEYGHVFGDQVIKAIIDKLKKRVRHSDYIGRIGGDEFCVLLVDVFGVEGVERWIQDLITDVHNITYEKVKDGMISISVGAVGIKGETSVTNLFEKADKAMYQAKQNGKNTYGIYR